MLFYVLCLCMLWCVDLREIKCNNVSIYSGKLDRGTTIHMATHIHHLIHGSTARFIDNKGHLLFFDVFIDILEEFTALATPTTTDTSGDGVVIDGENVKSSDEQVLLQLDGEKVVQVEKSNRSGDDDPNKNDKEKNEQKGEETAVGENNSEKQVSV